MDEKLPFALHAYQIVVHTSTRETPFYLVYVMEIVFPIKIEIPFLRVQIEVELEKMEWVRVRYKKLNLIKEKRVEAFCHGQLYKKRMIQAHDKKVHPR